MSCRQAGERRDAAVLVDLIDVVRVSFEPAGSVALDVTIIDVPSIRVELIESIEDAGLALATLIVWLVVADPPSSSLTVNWMSYEPLSSGVKLKDV